MNQSADARIKTFNGDIRAAMDALERQMKYTGNRVSDPRFFVDIHHELRRRMIVEAGRKLGFRETASTDLHKLFSDE